MPLINEHAGFEVSGTTDRSRILNVSEERIFIGDKPVKVVNQRFLNNVDVETIVGGAEKKMKLLVMDQFPKEGELVPAGTPVKLVMMYKEMIDVDNLIGLNEVLQEKYAEKQVVDVLNDIEESTAAKAVFEKGKEYDELTAGEKEVVDKYAQDKSIINADASDESKKKVYKDLNYMYNF